MSHHTETLVIGAGPAGLTAAYLLSKQGRSVTVLERDPAQVGGITRTVSLQRLPVRHRRPPLLLEVARRWSISGTRSCPNDFIERPRLSRIYYRGKYYAYPLKAFEALRNLGRADQRGLRGLLPLRPRRGRSPSRRPSTTGCATSSASGCSRSSSRPTPRRCGACPATTISADWAAQRIKGLDLGVGDPRRAQALARPEQARKAGGPVDQDADRIVPLSRAAAPA